MQSASSPQNVRNTATEEMRLEVEDAGILMATTEEATEEETQIEEVDTTKNKLLRKHIYGPFFSIH